MPCSPEHPLSPARVSGQPPWHRSADNVDRRRTEGWYLDRAGELLGLLPDINSRIQERIATRLRLRR